MSVDCLSVAEAAEALGVTRDAVHKRINRGTIEHEKGEDGRFYVYVDTSTEGLGTSTDMSVDKSKVEALERLIDSQHDRIAFLERELDRRGDETTRLHQIVAGLTQANAQLCSCTGVGSPAGGHRRRRYRRGGAGEGKRAALRYGRGSGRPTEALVA